MVSLAPPALLFCAKTTIIIIWPFWPKILFEHQVANIRIWAGCPTWLKRAIFFEAVNQQSLRGVDARSPKKVREHQRFIMVCRLSPFLLVFCSSVVAAILTPKPGKSHLESREIRISSTLAYYCSSLGSNNSSSVYWTRSSGRGDDDSVEALSRSSCWLATDSGQMESITYLVAMGDPRSLLV